MVATDRGRHDRLGTQSQTGTVYRRQTNPARCGWMESDAGDPDPISCGQLALHQPEQSVSDDGGLRRAPVARVLGRLSQRGGWQSDDGRLARNPVRT